MTWTPVPEIGVGLDRIQAICSYIMGLRQHSERHNWNYRRRLPRIYDLYRGARTNRFHVHKNALSVPLMYTIIWSHAARIMGMVYGTNPAIRFQGAGDTGDEAKIARKHDNLFTAQFRDACGLEKSLDIIVNAALYGTAIIQHGWKYERGTIVTPDVTTLPFSERTVQIMTEEDVVNFDGPTFELVDNLDAFPQPGFKRLNDMRWFIRRYWLDFAQVEALSQPGNTKEPIFDPAEVRRLQRDGGGGQQAFDALKTQRGISLAQDDDETARLREQYAKPVEITEAVGIHVPKELTNDGLTFRVCTIANGRYLLRWKPFPLRLNRKPYLALSLNPDLHNFFAPGRGEIVEKLQLGINKFTNQVLDALDVSIDPWFVFDRAANIDPRNLFLRPGRWIPVDGPPGERIMPGSANLNGLQAGIESTQLLWQYMQRATGILDESVIGLRAPGRSTARGDLARAETVAGRLVLEAMLFESQILEPLADAFLAHNKQFLDTPREFLILGDSALVDMVSKQPIPKGREVLMPGDLVPNYSARAIGTQARAVRSGRIQDMLLFMQIIGSSPTLAAAASSANAIRLVGRELGLGAEADELIGSNPEFNQLLATVGGNPQNIPNLNLKEGTPGSVGNLNALASLAGTMGG